jgi:glycosyltransferase involved in cell wall biosynthesis
MLTISIIVPVYNVEQYLSRCLDSILNQTFTDFELLLIDDGSPDKSGQICDEYAQKDSRIQVFHKENGGVSSARNTGLDNAKGKWIAFIDSDDWVDGTYLEHLLEGDEDVELRVMGLMVQNVKQKWKKQATREELFLINDFWRFYELYMLYTVFTGPPVKLFLLSVINKNSIRFDTSLSYGEDVIFNLQYLQYIRSISVKNYTEYYYRNTGYSSLSKTTFSERYEKFINNLEQVILPLLNDKRLVSTFNNYLANEYLSLYRQYLKQLYIQQNLKAKERRKSLSQIFAELSNRKFNSLHYLSIIKGKKRCIICLYYVPLFVVDIIFLFLFWIKRQNNS